MYYPLFLRHKKRQEAIYDPLGGVFRWRKCALYRSETRGAFASKWDATAPHIADFGGGTGIARAVGRLDRTLALEGIEDRH